MSLKHNLTTIIGGIGLSLAQPNYSLEARADQGTAQVQPADQQISDPWRNKFSVKGVYSDAFVLSQQAQVSDPINKSEYTAEIIYTGRKGSSGLLTEWTAEGFLYTKTDPSKPVSHVSAKGSMGSNGIFDVEITNVILQGTLAQFGLLMHYYGLNAVSSIRGEENKAVQAPAWLSSMTQHYTNLTQNRTNLSPLK